MKEDKLEEFIRTNRAAFDEDRPSPEVWKGIEKDIKPPIKINYPRFLWRAASVVIIFAASFMANEFWHEYRNEANAVAEIQEEAVEQNIPELVEAEIYYTAKMENRMRELKAYQTTDVEIEKELKVEMVELDKAFEELKNDLKEDMDNDEIIEAMIQNYRIKVRLLEEILSRLKSQDNKVEKDESIEYEI